MGIPVVDDLFNISFADEQVITVQDTFELEYVLPQLFTSYGEWGLNINISRQNIWW